MLNRDSLGVSWAPRLLSVLRIITGFLFIWHGTQKLFGFPVAAGYQTAELFSLRGLAGILEFAGGLLIILGLFTRPVAFVMSGFMAVAYFMAHAPKNFWPVLNQGDLAVLFCFVFLYLSAAGAGPWSLDHWLQRRSATPGG